LPAGFFFRGIRDYPSTIFGDGDNTRRLMKGAWHMLSWVMIGSAAALFTMAFTNLIPDGATLARFIAAGWTGATAAYLWYALPRPFMLIRTPIWINTVGTVVFSWLGSR
jgi:hypothetical protein